MLIIFSKNKLHSSKDSKDLNFEEKNLIVTISESLKKVYCTGYSFDLYSFEDICWFE